MLNNKKEEKKVKLSNKPWALVSILFVGVAILILLSLNFTSTYQFKGMLNPIDSNATYNKVKLNNLNKSEDKQAKQAEEEKEEKEAEERVALDIKKEIKNEVINIDGSCKDLLSFVHDYYQLKIKIDGGMSFTNELLELNKYKIKSDKINQHLRSLATLSSANMKNEYFKLKFNSLIKELYRLNNRSPNIISGYIRRMIFIRPIGDRAIVNGGFDMEISLTEKALIDNKLDEALIHVDKLPNNYEDLKIFKTELQNKLAINETLKQLDNIISSKLDCDVVGKY